jgi:CubicO group peptidase (beta-lactamase class C family)
MSQTAQIHGFCPPHLDAGRAVFEGHFQTGQEIGARFALAQHGKITLDLYAGHSDLARSRAFDAQTLTPIFSCTKAVASLMMARLVDQGLIAYDQPVASIWPDFGAAGKSAITLEQVLSHQAGLCGLEGPFDPQLWYDPEAICARLAAMAPLWPRGSASGYHPITVGYLVGEIFRRLDGRSLGTALRQDVCQPLDLDIWIGLPTDEHGRCAQMQRPKALPDLGPRTEARRLAFGTAWAAPSGREGSHWRSMEIASANGHATAPALARLMSVLACDGLLDGQAVLSGGMAKAVMREQIAGDDLVLPRFVGWGAGLMRNDAHGLYGPGPNTVGHYGWGGSCVFADPETGLSGAYVMNRQSAHLVGDPRAMALMAAAYQALT